MTYASTPNVFRCQETSKIFYVRAFKRVLWYIWRILTLPFRWFKWALLEGGPLTSAFAIVIIAAAIFAPIMYFSIRHDYKLEAECDKRGGTLITGKCLDVKRILLSD